ncbi:MAG: peptide-methionine (S)-S-oxide reductase MsrA [Rhodanobacter sp.]
MQSIFVSLRALRRAFAGIGIALLVSANFAFDAQASQSAPTNAAATASKPDRVATAVFAGGCFWCVESDFDKVPGVISTTSGYTGGTTPNPTYEQVGSGNTGHAESVEIQFDPARVSYKQLVEHFWRTIDPTTRDREFCDVGTPYRTAVFAQDAEQLAIAEASKAALEKSKPFSAPIVTEVVQGGEFYPAEDYHQNYYKKNPIRYKVYRYRCGRDARLKQLWGDQAIAH